MIHSIIHTIRNHWNNKPITSQEVAHVVEVQSKFNQTLRQYSDNPFQGCMYCILVRHRRKTRIKIGYSTFGGVASENNRHNIFNRLNSHYHTYDKIAYLFVTPVHNEAIEREFHRTMAKYEKPIMVSDKNQKSKTLRELYSPTEDIVIKLSHFLNKIMNNRSSIHNIKLPSTINRSKIFHKITGSKRKRICIQ